MQDVGKNKIEISELYKLAKSMLKKKGIHCDEDVIQELVTYAVQAIPKFDSTKSAKSTFFYYVMWNKYLMLERAKKTLQGTFDKNCISLNRNVTINNNDGDEAEIGDIVASSNNYRNKNEIDKLISEIKPLLSEEFKLWIRGYTQAEIAKSKKVAQNSVSRKINRNIKSIQNLLNKDGMFEYYKKIFMTMFFE